MVHPGVYKGLLRDDGYFSEVSAIDRIAIAENTYDLGEYDNDEIYIAIQHTTADMFMFWIDDIEIKTELM